MSHVTFTLHFINILSLFIFCTVGIAGTHKLVTLIYISYIFVHHGL